MSQMTAIIFMAILYIGIPLSVFLLATKAYRTWKRGRQLSFVSMPKLTYVTSKNLPESLTKKLESINEKAKKLLEYYNDNQISTEGVLDENQFLVNKILDVHLPEAIADYQRLDNTRANEMAVGATGKTATVLLTEYLDTINSQFDNMLDATYEQNAQKLLVTNRYLQNRFSESQLKLADLHEQTTVISPPSMN